MTENSLLGTILLVDDDPLHLNLFKKLLDAPDVQLLTAKDGVEAVTLLNNHEIDLVVTDTNMPRMNGADLLMMVRIKYPKIPVIIFFSGLIGSELSKEDLYKMGAAEILDKQDAKHKLKAFVYDLLSASSPRH